MDHHGHRTWGRTQINVGKRTRGLVSVALEKSSRIHLRNTARRIVLQICDEEELRVDGGGDSNLVPEDEQQLKI